MTEEERISPTRIIVDSYRLAERLAEWLAERLAAKPTEFLLEEQREKKGGARDTDTNQAKTFPSL